MATLQHRALVFYQDNDPAQRLRLEPLITPPLQAGEARVQLQAAALNHRDEWIRQGKYPGIISPCVLGSDGCGVVTEAHDLAGQPWLGQEVLVNPNVNWGPDPRVQGPHYSIRGNPTPGTFQQWLAVPAHRLAHKPAHLTAQQAAALPLAGLTAYRAVVTHGFNGISQAEQLAPGSRVLITGIGGGVATLAAQFARLLGAATWATSGDPDKLARAQELLGLAGGVSYRRENWPRLLQDQAGRFDLIVDSAGGASLNDLIDLLAPGGTIVIYGATVGLPPDINLRKLFYKQGRLQGSTMGNDQEFEDMLALVAQRRMVPVVDERVPFDQILRAFQYMADGKQFGKLVVSIA